MQTDKQQQHADCLLHMICSQWHQIRSYKTSRRGPRLTAGQQRLMPSSLSILVFQKGTLQYLPFKSASSTSTTMGSKSNYYHCPKLWLMLPQKHWPKHREKATAFLLQSSPKFQACNSFNFDHKLLIPCFLINGQQLSDQPFGNLLFTLDHPMSFHTIGQLSKLHFSFPSFFLCKFNSLHKNLSRRISPL